jgi:hypothetical protein
MKLRSYLGRLVRLVKTVGKDPNCVLFVTVEIITRWQLVFGLDSGDRLLLDLEDKRQEKCRIVREDVEVWWSAIVLTLLRRYRHRDLSDMVSTVLRPVISCFKRVADSISAQGDQD